MKLQGLVTIERIHPCLHKETAPSGQEKLCGLMVHVRHILDRSFHSGGS